MRVRFGYKTRGLDHGIVQLSVGSLLKYMIHPQLLNQAVNHHLILPDSLNRAKHAGEGQLHEPKESHHLILNHWGIDIDDLEVPVVSNCWAIPITEKDSLKKNMVEQMTSPVRWEDGIRFMIQEGVTTFIEVGPGKVLTGLIKRIDRQARVINISDSASVERFKEALQ